MVAEAAFLSPARQAPTGEITKCVSSYVLLFNFDRTPRIGAASNVGILGTSTPRRSRDEAETVQREGHLDLQRVADWRSSARALPALPTAARNAAGKVREAGGMIFSTSHIRRRRNPGYGPAPDDFY